ncbi:MAG: phage tail tape measure protein [Sphingobacteriaceae bacterium]|nr:phage tail tape measure protein [Sphingobacteriaceae bacterium]
MSDRNIKIAIILSAIDRASSVIKKADAASKKAFKIGKDAAITGVAMGAPIMKLIEDAKEFETKMVDIRKQMQVDTADTVARMTKQVMNLGRELPIATENIQDLISSGLRMNIPEKNIVEFTKQVTKMSVAFDMEAGEIADSMGKIANVFKIPIEKIGGFADAINYLDDNTLAKGPDLINVLQRIAGAAGNLDPKKAAALASTMLSAGETPETAATAINTMINRLSTATMQADRFKDGMAMLGLNAKKVQDIMADPKSAQGGLIDVFEKINQLDKSKRSEAVVRLFGTDAGPKLMKLSNNLAEYKRQLLLVNGSEKGSMDKEYQKRIKSSTSQWQIFKNKLQELSVTAGTTLLPKFNEIISKIGRIIDRVSNFATQNQGLVSTILSVVAVGSALSFVVSGLSFVFGGLFKVISFGTSVFRLIKTAQLAYQTAMLAGSTVTGGFRAAMAALNLTLLMNPIVLIVAAVVALIAGLVIAYYKSEKFRAIMDGVFEVGKMLFSVFSALGKILKGIFTFDFKLMKEGLTDVGKLVLKIKDGGISKAFNKGYDNSLKASKIAADAEKVNGSGSVMPAMTAMQPAPKPAPMKPTTSVNFAPVINLNGGATKADGQKITGQVKSDFEKLMKEQQAKERRVSY